MTFSLYALLNDDAPLISNESLIADLKTHFRNEKNFSLELEQLPFSKNKSLALRWSNWLVRMNYEEGEDVKNDSIEIGKRVTPFSAFEISHIARRIRVVFGSDDEQQYTNEIVYIIDFLKGIRGASIFDPQQNDFV